MTNNNFTTTKIDFINKLDKSIKINYVSKFHYIKIYKWEILLIKHLVESIRNDDVFTVFPFISCTGNFDDPYLRLSDHFLITNNSDPKLIANFLNEQWFTSEFMLVEGRNANLYFKIKKVILQKQWI